jgi:hypothetical protein
VLGHACTTVTRAKRSLSNTLILPRKGYQWYRKICAGRYRFTRLWCGCDQRGQ